MGSKLTCVVAAAALYGSPIFFFVLMVALPPPLVRLFDQMQALAVGRAPGAARACECCRCDHDGGYGSGRFCSVHCARRVAASRKWAKRRLSAVRFLSFLLRGAWPWHARASVGVCVRALLFSGSMNGVCCHAHRTHHVSIPKCSTLCACGHVCVRLRLSSCCFPSLHFHGRRRPPLRAPTSPRPPPARRSTPTSANARGRPPLAPRAPP